MSKSFPHELFEQLDAANPNWQRDYKTLVHAAQDLGLHSYLEDYLHSAHGRAYRARMDGVIDWAAVSERNRRQHEAEVRMAAGLPPRRHQEDDDE